MDLLGIGPLELILIFLVILLVLGPNDLIKTGKKIGRFLRKLTHSETWKSIRTTGEELRKLPTQLIREAEIESYLAENPEFNIAPPDKNREYSSIDQDPPGVEEGLKAWTTPPETSPTPPPTEDNNG